MLKALVSTTLYSPHPGSSVSIWTNFYGLQWHSVNANANVFVKILLLLRSARAKFVEVNQESCRENSYTHNCMTSGGKLWAKNPFFVILQILLGGGATQNNQRFGDHRISLISTVVKSGCQTISSEPCLGARTTWKQFPGWLIRQSPSGEESLVQLLHTHKYNCHIHRRIQLSGLHTSATVKFTEK